jgi:hypothetical protein
MDQRLAIVAARVMPHYKKIHDGKIETRGNICWTLPTLGAFAGKLQSVPNNRCAIPRLSGSPMRKERS